MLIDEVEEMLSWRDIIRVLDDILFFLLRLNLFVGWLPHQLFTNEFLKFAFQFIELYLLHFILGFHFDRMPVIEAWYHEYLFAIKFI